MNRQEFHIMDNHLVLHLGQDSELTLVTPDRTLRCYPGDLRALSAADVTLVADLLRAGALSTTGQIRKKGHDLVEKLVMIQHLPALQLENRLLTSTDVRAFQIAKATVAAAIEALLFNAGLKAEDVAVTAMESLDGPVCPQCAKRVGLIPAKIGVETGAKEDAETEAEVVDLTADERVIHSYTENMFFPK